MSVYPYERDPLSRLLSEELRIINRHLPYKQVSLCKLEEMDIPYIHLRDGTTHLIDPNEIKLLAKLLGGDKCKLMIPIIIEAVPGQRETAYWIRDPYAAKALASLLGLSWNEDKPLIIYRPHLYEVRSRLPTTTTIIFNPKQFGKGW